MKNNVHGLAAGLNKTGQILAAAGWAAGAVGFCLFAVCCFLLVWCAGGWKNGGAGAGRGRLLTGC